MRVPVPAFANVLVFVRDARVYGEVETYEKEKEREIEMGRGETG